MKKLTVLTATALTIAGIGSQTLVAHAAPGIRPTQPVQGKQVEFCQNGNKVIISYGSGCNIQDLLEQLENCLPQPNLPGTDRPEINIPEIDVPDTDTPEDNTSENNVHPYIKTVVDLVNEERAKEGLSPLTLDFKILAAAQVRAMECEQLFSHTRPDGSSFTTALTEQNVSYRRAGENIAWGQHTPQQVVSGWMNSEGHRANIMNPNFTKIGVGYYQNAKGTNYWCQLFTN